jgi:HEAT repeat protein
MVLGLFSKERSLRRAAATVVNKLAPSEDRLSAMEKLSADGSEESLYALCTRFSFEYDKSIQDHQEKDWVVSALAAHGQATLPALKRYMKMAKSLGFSFKVLAEIADADTGLGVVDELLADEPPGYTRDPKRRMDVIEFLAEWEGASDSEVVRRIIPYVADFDGNVRFKAIDAIGLRSDPNAAEPLLNALLNPEEESARIKQRIAEVLADGEMELGERKQQVQELTTTVLSEFKLQRDKLVRK